MPNSVGQKLLIGRRRITYALRDEFTTDAAAPLSSPHTAEPGPGTITTTDSGNRWLITGGILETNDGSTAVTLAQSTHTRAAGLTFRHKTLQNSAQGTDANKTISPGFGWSKSSGSAAAANLTGVFFWTAIGQFYVYDQDGSSTGAWGIDTCASDAYYEFAHVLRSTGGFSLVKTGGIWKLVYIHGVGNAATMYAIAGNQTANRHPAKMEYFRVAQLGSPWNTDYPATDRLAGARAATDTFTHEAGAQWIEFGLTTLPSSGNIEIEFRRTDSNNCWKLQVTSAGAFNLVEIVTGTPTTRATIASNANGDRLLCVMDGASARLIRYRATAITNSSLYSSVATFTTQNSGVISSLGTGGAVSDLIAWPRNISGAAHNELERMTI